MSKKISFITGNAGKLREVQAIMAQYPDVAQHVVIDKTDCPDLVEIQEGDFTKMLLYKVNEALKHVPGPILLEDTWLGFDALGGLPGAYIKWFLDRLGPAGLERMLAGFETRTATATCIFAFCEGPGHEPVLFKGETTGTIVPPRGANNFGWDPIFQPDVPADHPSAGDISGRTYAELAPEHKNSLSHRRKALGLVMEYLRDWVSKPRLGLGWGWDWD
eukprot:JZ554158.1.p1 GENE.JZ554158.1~~JZ554158.1.p1  ORF type:complete len:218 (+),score=39.08 JZ554158.1:24-677(+)